MATGDTVLQVTDCVLYDDEVSKEPGVPHATQNVTFERGTVSSSQSGYNGFTSLSFKLTGSLPATGPESGALPSAFDGTKHYTVTITED